MPSKPFDWARLGDWPAGSVGFCGEATPGVGTGAPSSRPSASVCSRNGPNSSPNQNVPSGAICIDSMSKSQPVRTRSGAGHAYPAGSVGAALQPPSRQMVQGMWPSGSDSPKPPSTTCVTPVVKSGTMRWTHSSKSWLLGFAPNPLSLIAR